MNRYTNDILQRLKENNLCLKFPDSVIVQRKNNICLVFDPMKPDWFFCSDIFFPIIEMLKGKKTISEIYSDSVEKFHISYFATECFIKFIVDGLYVFELDDLDSNVSIAGNILDMVYLQVTSQCNLNCIYCYRDSRNVMHNELSMEDVEKIILEIREIKPNATFVLTGGEPTLRHDIVEICSLLKEFGFRVEMNTNGMLLPKKHSLVSVVDVFNVSVDGSCAEIHESSRGGNTYKKVEESISFLKENGCKIVISPTYTSMNIHDMPNMINKYKHIGCSFKSNFFMKIGKGKKIDELAVDVDQLCRIDSSLDFVDISTDFIPEKFIRKISCGMGIKYISIEANGNVFPCQLMHSPPFLMGNVRSASLMDIYFSSDVSKKCRLLNVNNYVMCNSCTIKYICGGGCRARSFYEQGQIDISDGFCKFWHEKYIDNLWKIVPKKVFDCNEM